MRAFRLPRDVEGKRSMKKIERLDEFEREKSRRRFLKRAGVAVATAPAAAVLLSASAKRVSADTVPEVSGQILLPDDNLVICWVAREVYGADNPRWLEFRTWLLTQAPAWFRDL